MNTDHLPHAVFDATGRKVAQLSNRAKAYTFSQDLNGFNNIEPVHCARSSHLTGHCADGGGVQAHSAGGLYPYVIAFRETPAGRRVEILGPGIDTAIRVQAYDTAIAAAKRLKAVAEIEDAWAFELEQLLTVCGRKVHGLCQAAARIAEESGRARWADRSKAERVNVLLKLGAARNTMKLPVTRPATFSELAARAV